MAFFNDAFVFMLFYQLAKVCMTSSVQLISSYVDYYRCVNSKGEDFEPCKQFFQTYHSLCPNEWVRVDLQ